MHLKTQYLGSCCWCWFRFCWSSSCHSCWVWLYRNVSHEKASAVLAVLRRIITCLNFPGDCIGANKLPYKEACSYLVDCIIIWRLLWEWEYELNSRQPLQRAIFLFVRMFLNRSPASFRSRTESCYWLTVGKDFIGSFGADWPYWAQVLHASRLRWTSAFLTKRGLHVPYICSILDQSVRHGPCKACPFVSIEVP